MLIRVPGFYMDCVGGEGRVSKAFKLEWIYLGLLCCVP
jgi:hypothetical protein